MTLEPLACSLAWGTIFFYKSANILIHNQEVKSQTTDLNRAVSLTALIIIKKIRDKYEIGHSHC